MPTYTPGTWSSGGKAIYFIFMSIPGFLMGDLLADLILSFRDPQQSSSIKEIIAVILYLSVSFLVVFYIMKTFIELLSKTNKIYTLDFYIAISIISSTFVTFLLFKIVRNW